MANIVKTIGTATRDYSTPQAWEDALPVNMVTDGNSQEGDLYNDAEFVTAGAILLFSGCTTDATHGILLTCGSGQSFRDNANVQTNALRYNQANGVGLRQSGAYGDAVAITTNFVTLRGLQIAMTGGGNSDRACKQNVGATDTVLEDCIFEAAGTNSNGATGVVYTAGNSFTVRNCLIVNRANSGSEAIGFDYASGHTIVFVNNTLVRPSDKTVGTAAALRGSNGTVTITNCCWFGFASSNTGGTTFTGSNNCSDVAIGFGTSNQASKTYANQFQNTSDATRDFRLKTGSDCIDNGVTDSTNAATDIVGTTRPQGSAYDIGCWELLVTIAGPYTFKRYNNLPPRLFRPGNAR